MVGRNSLVAVIMAVCIAVGGVAFMITSDDDSPKPATVNEIIISAVGGDLTDSGLYEIENNTEITVSGSVLTFVDKSGELREITDEDIKGWLLNGEPFEGTTTVKGVVLLTASMSTIEEQKEEIEAQKETIQEKEEQIKALEQKVAGLQEELEKSKAETAKLEKQIGELEQFVKSLTEEIDELRNSYEGQIEELNEKLIISDLVSENRKVLTDYISEGKSFYESEVVPNNKTSENTDKIWKVSSNGDVEYWKCYGEYISDGTSYCWCKLVIDDTDAKLVKFTYEPAQGGEVVPVEGVYVLKGSVIHLTFNGNGSIITQGKTLANVVPDAGVHLLAWTSPESAMYICDSDEVTISAFFVAD